jgi:hypothetical protein
MYYIYERKFGSLKDHVFIVENTHKKNDLFRTAKIHYI